MERTSTAARLRQIMNERNLRQVDILEMCDPYCKKYDVVLTKSHLSQYLAGKFAPKQDKLTVLSLALGVSEAWLMGYDVEPGRKPIMEDVSLNRIEKDLIQNFRSLNREGQSKAASYISDLSGMNKYKKHDINDVVEGA